MLITSWRTIKINCIRVNLRRLRRPLGITNPTLSPLTRSVANKLWSKWQYRGSPTWPNKRRSRPTDIVLMVTGGKNWSCHTQGTINYSRNYKLGDGGSASSRLALVHAGKFWKNSQIGRCKILQFQRWEQRIVSGEWSEVLYVEQVGLFKTTWAWARFRSLTEVFA